MSKRVAWLVAVSFLLGGWRAQGADETIRPLRYQPVGTDFYITNGTEFFNRPLYCSPGVKVDKNIAFTSQWDNDLRAVTVPLSGKASHGCFLNGSASGL